ncbi:MAG: AAA family ATPase [Bdellovibrionota bacterium]|mgnify:CR=1 FL=1
MFHRAVALNNKHSFFLFGPRGTGKSTLLRNTFQKNNILYIDLLDEEIHDRYFRKPQSLESEIAALPKKPNIVILDEVQKAPRLLNVVHKLIENEKIVFGLTGSSARKLRRGASNLLAGRAFLYRLFPLIHTELADRFRLDEVLRWGSLPKIFELETEQEKEKFLRSYALTYLKEEIVAEQVTRKLEPFREFLEVAAQLNGKIINAASAARDVGVDIKTVQTYYQILEDTLVGFYLPGYDRSIKKAQRQKPKFYWFDIGVKRAIEGTLDIPCNPRTSFYGETFEHFIILEIFRLNQYLEKNYRLSYLQTYDESEVDLVLSKPGRESLLIEIKSSAEVDEHKAAKLARHGKEIGTSKMFYLSQDPVAKKINGVRCMHWQAGLVELGLLELTT